MKIFPARIRKIMLIIVNANVKIKIKKFWEDPVLFVMFYLLFNGLKVFKLISRCKLCCCNSCEISSTVVFEVFLVSSHLKLSIAQRKCHRIQTEFIHFIIVKLNCYLCGYKCEFTK